MKENFLHVGYHKTGTSWMQKFMFPTIFKGEYFGKSFESEDHWGKKDWKFLDTIAKGETGLLSNEWIMKQNPNIYNIACDIKSRLTCKNTKIIISIRNQKELMLSRFMHLSSSRFKMWDLDLNSCLFKPSGSKKSRRYLSERLYWYYNFAETYKIFINEFGKSNVHIIIYENLFENTECEIKRFLNFTNKDIRESDKELIFNSSTIKENEKKFDERVKLWESMDDNIKKTILLKIENRYEESNKQMSELIGFDLRKYGYHK